MSGDIKEISTAVGLLFAILINKRLISLKEVRSLLPNGFRIKEVI